MHMEEESRKVWIGKWARTWIPIVFYRVEVLKLGFISQLTMECLKNTYSQASYYWIRRGWGMLCNWLFQLCPNNSNPTNLKVSWDTSEGSEEVLRDRRVARHCCQASEQLGPGGAGPEEERKAGLRFITWRAGPWLTRFLYPPRHLAWASTRCLLTK